MKLRLSLPLLAVFVFLCLSCDRLRWSSDEERIAVARVGKAYLYLDELSSMLPDNLEPDDSLLKAKLIIENWARNQVILQKAEYNLNTELDDLDKLVRDYRNDLIKFKYQQAMVRKQLDTVVTSDQISKYLSANSQNFVLKENILQTSFVVFSKETPKLQEAKKWWRSSKDSDKNKFKLFVTQYAEVNNMLDTTWRSFNELETLVPIQSYNQQDFLRQNRYVEVEDEKKVYWLEIRDYKIKDAMSPLIYVESTIRSIIINQRKLAILDKLEKELFEEAVQNNEYEVFERD